MSAETYDAVMLGCEKDCSLDEMALYSCHGVTVSETTFNAIHDGCTQRCLGGSVEISGGNSEGGVGGSVYIRGGDGLHNETGMGGNINIVAGTSASGPGGAVARTGQRRSGNGSIGKGISLIGNEHFSPIEYMLDYTSISFF